MDSYISAAFRSTRQNEAYIIFMDKYVVDKYYPGEARDEIVEGPAKNSERFANLKATNFDKPGIDCAFATHDAGQVYIFSGSTCALQVYSPDHPEIGHYLKGPAPIKNIFPFLEITDFESGIDAAFVSSIRHEAYLFKEDKYARISYAGSDPRLMNQGSILEFWPFLKDLGFDSHIGAAFASHRLNEVYLFKEENYVRIKYNPDEPSQDELINNGKIKDYFPELGKLLPQ